MEHIYATGRGSFRVRSLYAYDKSAGCIDITQIPPTTTVEAIVEKVVDLVRQGKIREISDIRDETGLEGLKITIDLKRGADPDRLMQRLFKMTPLEDSFSCNFNVLVQGSPRVLGVRELLSEWTSFRVECVRRRTAFDLRKKQEKLHLLKGLAAILLDIDKAISIVRGTEEEAEVVPNLMIGFGIDQVQAEYVAEMKLRHLNREYILKRTQETEQMEKEIADLQKILGSEAEIKKIILRELDEVAKKYGKPRRSMLVYPNEIEDTPEEEIPDYPVNLFFTREGYFKKITPQSLRMSGEQKLKEGDRVVQHVESSNTAELLFFTDRCTVYKTKTCEFADTKASVLGEYLPAKLEMEKDETPVFMAVTQNYSGDMLFFFENGKVSKIDLSAYETKTNRHKLVGAYGGQSPLVFCAQTDTPGISADILPGKDAFAAFGVGAGQGCPFRAGNPCTDAPAGRKTGGGREYSEGLLEKPERYRKKIPSIGALPSRDERMGKQLTLTGSET